MLFGSSNYFCFLPLTEGHSAVNESRRPSNMLTILVSWFHTAEREGGRMDGRSVESELSAVEIKCKSEAPGDSWNRR